MAAHTGVRARRRRGHRGPHGEELGMAMAPLGDDRQKGGENIWISRMSIDLVLREAQSVLSSETKARRTSSEHRKVGAREARREAARRNEGKPRERCKARSRDGSEPRKGSVTGVGWRIRTAMVRGASRWLPWSRRGRLGRGLSDTTPARRQRVIADVCPEEHGRLRPNGYSGFRRVWALVLRSVPHGLVTPVAEPAQLRLCTERPTQACGARSA